MLSTSATKADLEDRFIAIRRQEDNIYSCADYLSPAFQAKQAAEVANNPNLCIFASGLSACSTGSSSSCTGINDVWREKICEWSYQVIDHFDFNREIVSISLSYLDRYLSTRPVNRKIFQLAAMTSLYLAIKLYEPSTLKMSSFIELSRGYFSTEHIIAMETAILRALSWHVHPPTSLTTVKHFMLLIPEHSCPPHIFHEIKELSRFLTELSVCDYFFVQKKATTIGLASLLVAIGFIGEGFITPSAHQSFLDSVRIVAGCDYNSHEVLECKARLRDTYIQGGFHDQHQKDRLDGGGTSPVCVSSVPQSQNLAL